MRILAWVILGMDTSLCRRFSGEFVFEKTLEMASQEPAPARPQAYLGPAFLGTEITVTGITLFWQAWGRFPAASGDVGADSRHMDVTTHPLCGVSKHTVTMPAGALFRDHAQITFHLSIPERCLSTQKTTKTTCGRDVEGGSWSRADNHTLPAETGLSGHRDAQCGIISLRIQ